MHIARAEPSYLHRLVTKVEAKGFWHLHRMGVEPPKSGSAVVLDHPAAAYIGRGAWRVGCPFCTGSQFGTPGHDRFCCCDCGNKPVDHQWVQVTYPANVDEIEAVLLRRPTPETMNWMPYETVADLWAENVAHGIDELGAVPKAYRKAVKALVDDRKKPTVHAVAPGAIVHPDSEWAVH